MTQTGKDFLKLSDRWKQLFCEMNNIKALMSESSFVISALNSVSSALLPQVFLKFLEKNPKIFLKSEDLSSYASYDAIENRSVDFAIIVDKRYSLNLACKPLFSENMLVISSKFSSLPEKLSLKDLKLENFIYCPWFLEFEQWCQLSFSKNFQPYIQVQILHQINFILENKDSWAIVPSTLAKILEKEAEIKIHQSNFKIPKRKVSYLHLIENGCENHIIANFLNFLKIELRELEKNGILECDFV